MERPGSGFIEVLWDWLGLGSSRFGRRLFGGEGKYRDSKSYPPRVRCRRFRLAAGDAQRSALWEVALALTVPTDVQLLPIHCHVHSAPPDPGRRFDAESVRVAREIRRVPDRDHRRRFLFVCVRTLPVHEVQIEPATYTAARWLADPAKALPPLGGGTAMAVDRQERRVLLFATEWEIQYFERQHPTIALFAESPVGQ